MSKRLDAALIFVIAWIAAVVYRTIWPFILGRDFETYVWYYVEMWRDTPAFPFLMAYRTPLTPLFIGALSELGGMTALTIAMNTCYAIAVTATYCIGAFWSRSVGVAAAVVTLGYVGFGALYREVGSDVLFGTAFLAWCAWITSTYHRITVATYVTHALCVFVLTMIRPASQALLVFAIFPWVVQLPADTRTRIRCAAAFVATAAVLLGAFATYNAVRYQDFTIARGGNAINGFYRAFIMAKIVREENGPASRELAQAVRADLLTHDPYRSYGVTDTMFFEDGDARGWSDLVALSDRTWGWAADYAMLRRAAIEAVAADPMPFLTGVGHDAMATLGIIGYPPPVAPPPAVAATPKPTPPGLPVPTEGQRVPTAYVQWWMSSPTGQIHSGDIPTRARYTRIVSTIPSRPGLPQIWNLLEKAQKMFPPPIIWIAAGVIGTIRLGGVKRRVLYLLVAMALIAPMAGVVGQGLVYHYRLPADPLFITFGLAGFWRTGLGRAAADAS